MGRYRGERWLPLEPNLYPGRILIAAVAGTTFIAIAATAIHQLRRSPENHEGEDGNLGERRAQARKQQPPPLPPPPPLPQQHDGGGYANTAGCSSSVAKRSIANEILVLQSLALASPEEDARNIVRVVSLGTAPCSIVMERLPGDLHEVLSGSCRFKKWSTEERVTRIMTQIVAGLDYLHSHGWTHADVKPANILVNESLTTVKISDFGISGRSGKEKSHGGTRVYTAPEAAGGLQKQSVAKVLDPTMDAFSVGLVLVQVLQASVHPITFYKARSTAKVLEDPRALQVFKLIRPSHGMLSKIAFPEQRQLAHPTKVVNVLRGLLHRDPRRRLTMAELQKCLACKGIWMKGNGKKVPAPRLPREMADLKRRLSRPMPGAWWESKDALLWWLTGDMVVDKSLEARVSNV